MVSNYAKLFKLIGDDVPEPQTSRETSETLESCSTVTKYNKQTGRPVRTTAGRRSLDPDYMNTTEVIQGEDSEDEDNFLDDDEDMYAKKRKKLQGGSRKRKRTLSPPPPSLSDAALDAFMSRENSPASSIGTLGESASAVAQPMMEPINLTFNIPLGFHGPIHVHIDPSFLQQLTKHTKSEQSLASEAITGLVQTNSVGARKTGFLNLAAELRIQIYRLVFVKESPVEISRPKNFSRSAALLRTCRQVYNEGCGILYGENTFHFDRDRNNRRKRWDCNLKEVGYKDFRRFLITIGPDNVSKMRDVIIDFEDCHPSDMPLGSTEERRFVHDGNLIECLKILGRNAKVRTLYLGFHGRRSLTSTDIRFLEHLCTIKADTVTFKPHSSLSHRWYYNINRVNADVRTKITKKMTRKTRLYPESIESIENTTDSEE